MRYARAGRVRSPLVAACLVSAQRTSGSVCVGRGPPRTARGNDIFLSERRQQATARRRGGEQADASRSSERRERWLRRASGSCERRRAAASGERAASTQRERARSESERAARASAQRASGVERGRLRAISCAVCVVSRFTPYAVWLCMAVAHAWPRRRSRVGWPLVQSRGVWRRGEDVRACCVPAGRVRSLLVAARLL
jgi:hypothetical protein